LTGEDEEKRRTKKLLNFIVPRPFEAAAFLASNRPVCTILRIDARESRRFRNAAALF
jgi:hypothetical protein